MVTANTGNGIGLSICKKIIERHGGNIAAAPRAGGGTIFKFTLPALHLSLENKTMGAGDALVFVNPDFVPAVPAARVGRNPERKGGIPLKLDNFSWLPPRDSHPLKTQEIRSR